MDISKLLKSRRLDLEMTLKDVAKAVGVSEGTVSRWENGQIINMRRDRVYKIADALSLSPNELLEYSAKEVQNLQEGELLARATNDKAAIELLGYYFELNIKRKTKLVDFAKAITVMQREA